MKRLLPIFLILAMALTACGAPAAPAAETPTPTVEPAFTYTAANYPAVMGGAAMEPLGRALAAVMLGRSQSDVTGFGSFGSTGGAYKALAAGECALALGLEPTAGVIDPACVELASIAKDALVFYVSAANPVDGLTAQQLRDVYSGVETGWKALGGADEPVAAFQSNASSGAQYAMRGIVMAGQAMAEPPMDYFPAEDGSLAQAVAGFDGSSGAIGYTTYYSAVTMGLADGYKLLAIDGVEANAETIASGEYPFTVSYQAAILADAAERSPERLLWEWLQCDAGQSLVSYCGYIAERGGNQ